MSGNLGIEQEFLCDNDFIRHPARCHVYHPGMKSSFNFTFDIIYTTDLITLWSSPWLLWKASKSWRSLFYVFSTSHDNAFLVWWQFLFLKHLLEFFCSRAVEKIDYSAHNLPPFSLILVFVRSAALLYSCVSAPPLLLTSLEVSQWPGLAVACSAAWTHFPHMGLRNQHHLTVLECSVETTSLRE